MLTRNHRGDVVRSHRSINTHVNAELLIGADWEAVAHIELKRLALVLGAYHSQLQDHPGHKETGEALKHLNAACQTIEESHDLKEAFHQL